MKRFVLSFSAMCAGCLPVLAQDAAPVETVIREVTLYADRALVTRSGDVQLAAGVQRVVLQGLPAWIDNASVRARLEPAAAGEIVDVQVKREFLAKTRNEEVQQAADALQEINDQLGEVEDQAAVLEARKKHVQQITAFNLEKLPRDAVTRDIPVKNYSDVVNFVSEEMTRIAADRRALDKQRRDLTPEKSARERRLAEVQSRARLEQRHVEIRLSAKQAGAARLVVSYFLPGATWEPLYEVRAEGDRVRLAAFAGISQTSGEEWSNVTLSLSTQNPGRTVSVPKLEALLVGAAGAGQIFHGQAKQSFAQANDAWIRGNSPNVDPRQTANYARNFARQQETQIKVLQQFNRLQERGTTAIFNAMGTQTVRSDGETVRVPIAAYEYQGKPRIVAAPEVSLNATQTLELLHRGEQPLLPGRVSLFQQGAFLGMTDVDFVAGGETFTLFAGLADEIKLSRTLDYKRSELRRGKRSNRMKVSFLVKVENLSGAEAMVRLADRIPVSNDDDVKVSSVSISPSIKPDSDGLLVWDLAVPPRQTIEVRINYTVDYPLVLKRNSDELVPAQSDQLDYQIRTLEKLF